MPASRSYAEASGPLTGPLSSRVGGEPRRRLAGEAAVAADHGADRKVQLAPPQDVGQVTEGAAHGDAGALVALGKVVRDHRDLDAEDRGGDRGAEHPLVALVVGVGDQGHRRRDQLGTRRLDVDRRPVGTVVGHPVVGAGVLARLDLGLCDRGAVGDVPDRGRLGEIGLAAREVAQERALADLPGVAARRRVGVAPVDREAELAPDLLEDLLVLHHELLAQLDEVGPADRDLTLRVRLLRWGEVRLVGQRRVAADAEVVLHAPLGRQPVVVPAHGVEDGLAAHPLEPRDEVGVGVGEDVPDVQRAAHRRRRRVDRVDVLARLGAVEGVGLIGLPALTPRLLEALESRLVGYDDGAGGRRRLHCLVLPGLGHGRNPRCERSWPENGMRG